MVSAGYRAARPDRPGVRVGVPVAGTLVRVLVPRPDRDDAPVPVGVPVTRTPRPAPGRLVPAADAPSRHADAPSRHADAPSRHADASSASVRVRVPPGRRDGTGTAHGPYPRSTRASVHHRDAGRTPRKILL